MKNIISVWICQIIAARYRKRNIGAISRLYRGYLEHWVDATNSGRRLRIRRRCGGDDEQ